MGIWINEQELLNLKGGNQERVDDFKYLGSMVATEEKHLRIRKGQA